MKKIVSFSLYGDNPLYVEGAIINTHLAKRFYPDFMCYVSVYKDCSQETCDRLREAGATVITITTPYRNVNEIISKCTLWRFYPLCDASVEYVLFRDCDSRISDKEAKAVQAWIASDKKFHLMYDHSQHTTPILAGLWGARGGSIPNIKSKIWSFIKKNDPDLKYSRSYDQAFLKTIIWPNYVSHSYLAHCDITSDYHREQNITTNPYPPHTPLEISNYLGKTITISGAHPKPPTHPHDTSM